MKFLILHQKNQVAIFPRFRKSMLHSSFVIFRASVAYAFANFCQTGLTKKVACHRCLKLLLRYKSVFLVLRAVEISTSSLATLERQKIHGWLARTKVLLTIASFDLEKLHVVIWHAASSEGRYTRGVLLPEHAPAARFGSKAPPCVPTISWVYFILGSRISTPQNAPRYLTG